MGLPCSTRLPSTYVAQADVLDKLRVKVHLPNGLLQRLEHEAVERRVLETALLRLAQGRPEGQSDDHIVGVLLLAVIAAVSLQSGANCGEDETRPQVETHMASMGLLPGVMWERMELKRSVAIARDMEDQWMEKREDGEGRCGGMEWDGMDRKRDGGRWISVRRSLPRDGCGLRLAFTRSLGTGWTSRSCNSASYYSVDRSACSEN